MNIKMVDKLGFIVKKIRVERGMTQVELAKKSKLTQGTISKLESTGYLNTVSHLIALSIALDIDLWNLG